VQWEDPRKHRPTTTHRQYTLRNSYDMLISVDISMLVEGKPSSHPPSRKYHFFYHAHPQSPGTHFRHVWMSAASSRGLLLGVDDTTALAPSGRGLYETYPLQQRPRSRVEIGLKKDQIIKIAYLNYATLIVHYFPICSASCETV